MKRRQFLGAAWAAIAAGTVVETAQAQVAGAPAGRLITGIAAAAASSVFAKEFLGLLNKVSKTRYQLETITTGGSFQAPRTVKAAAPDGLTLLHAVAAQMSVFPVTLGKLGYDPIADFTPLAMLGDYTWALTVGPLVPASVKTLDDYLGWVGDNPTWRNYGVMQFGSQGHLAGQLIARERGSAILPTTYVSTTAIIEDLKSRSLAAAFMLVGGGANPVMDDALRPIAVLSKERWHDLPQTPTLAEQGLKQIDMTGWYGWFAPAHTPDSISAPLIEALDAV
jgi:tripartite-type tricarboxylate transporter receptor subunit TctC